MPRSSCDFCCNPVELARYEPTWRGQVAGILCAILEAVSGGGPGGGCTCVTDGEAVNAAFTGGLALGTDGTNYQVLSVTADGELNVELIPELVNEVVNLATTVNVIANIVHSEDSPHTSGDSGVPVLAVQTATPASTAADGDYGLLKTDALGKLWTADSQIEDTGHTTGDRGSFVLGVRNDAAAALTTTDLDYSPIAVDSAGRLQLAAGALTLGSIASITTSVTPGTAAAELGKAEDAQHTSGDVGVFALAIRNDDAASTFATTNADYSGIAVDSVGRVFVNPGVAATSLGKAEDAVAGSGDVGVMALGVAQATPTATAADGDYIALKTNALGCLYNEPANQEAAYGATITAGAAGAVTTSGVTVHTNSSKFKILTVRNKLDVDIQISLDGGANWFLYVGVNESAVLDLGTNGRWDSSNVSARSIGANSASGNLYIGVVI